MFKFLIKIFFLIQIGWVVINSITISAGKANQSDFLEIMNPTIQISTRAFYNLALKKDGTVWEWGEKSFRDSKLELHSPKKITNLTNIINISTANKHSLALKSDSTVWEWGEMDGINSDLWPLKNEPEIVPNLNNVIQIETNDIVAVALQEDGTLWAWGEVISDDKVTETSTPIKISDISDVKQISLGSSYSWGSHYLALKEDGTVWAWGANESGQLGTGNTNERLAPTQINELIHVKYVKAGDGVSFAIKEDGTVWAWGYNWSGCLGINTDFPQYSPVQIPELNNIEMLGVSYYHTLALTEEGILWAWGNNASGQFGNGGAASSLTPKKVNGLDRFKSIAVGGYYSLALKEDGSIWAWGKNKYRNLADGNFSEKYSPVKASQLTQIKQILSGNEHSLALKEDGTVWTWGDLELTDHSIPSQIVGLDHVRYLACGHQHSLALLENGTIWSWGLVVDGKRILDPVQITELNNVKYVAAGYNHNFAVKEDNTLWAWGDNWSGQLGDGTTTSKDTPVQIFGLNDIRQIDGGFANSLALKNDGTVWEWGNGSTSPEQVSSLNNIKWISAASSTNFALKENGTVWTWGKRFDQNSENIITPIQITQLENVKLIESYGNHAFALKENGKLWAWGQNHGGVLGIGTTNDNFIPTQVQKLNNIVNINTGYRQSFAEDEEGNIWGWGANWHGQLGIGYPTLMPIPCESHVQFKAKSFVSDKSKIYITVINNSEISPLTIHYSTNDHTAVSGVDYNTAQGELNFNNNEKEKQFSIDILNNSERNEDRILVMHLSEPSNNIFSNYMSSAILTIPANNDNTAPYFQSFDTYLPGSGWSYYSSTKDGNIQVISGKLRMDGINENKQYLNEAILTLDLFGLNNITLSFFHCSKAFANDLLPDKFDNHHNGDGVCISNDGNIWYTIMDANDLKTDNIGKDFILDLDQEIKNIQNHHNVTLNYTKNFKIKFQQFGYREFPTDGREWDNISLTVDGIIDRDNDGIPDIDDKFPNDPNEWADNDNDDIGDNADTDDDNDKMPDSWELTYGLNPLIDDADQDPDQDGITNLIEYQNYSNPKQANQKPDAPALISPIHQVNNLEQPVCLVVDAFHDPDSNDTHAKTIWQLSTQTNFQSYLIDIESDSQLNRLPISISILSDNTTYYWRAQFFDQYGLASNWSMIYSFTTMDTLKDIAPINGIPDEQEINDQTIDIDKNGTPDIDQISSMYKCLNTVEENAQMSILGLTNVMEIMTFESVGANSITETTNRPTSIPWGLLNFNIKVLNPGDTAVLRIYFSTSVSSSAGWYKYNPINGWQNFSDKVIFEKNRNFVTFSLTDGGLGDADQTLNGVIADPSALVFNDSKATQPPGGDDGGGGGCFVKTILKVKK